MRDDGRNPIDRLGDPARYDLRGLMCQRDGCGKTMQFVYTLADVGAFCSARCRELASGDAAIQPKQKVG